MITAANASECGKKSWAARVKREQRLSELEEIVLSKAFHEPKEPDLPQVAPIASNIESNNSYLAERLLRVKGHLDSIDERLATAITDDPDGKLVRALADSQAKLAEQYRIMAGIPLPGSHRPVAPRPGSHRPPAGPLD